MNQSIIKLLEQIKQEQPLIHNITNQVVMNFTANGLYALGALPIMAHEKNEVAEIVAHADALVLNIGTLTTEILESMIVAGHAANKKGIPVVFDPVGVGVTTFRSHAAQRIMSEINLSLIRGNAAEISHLTGLRATARGVDASEVLDGPSIIKQSTQKLNVPILMTGKVDYIANQEILYQVSNGSELLTKVTGAGCLLSSIAGAFLAVSQSCILAVVAAVSYFTIAAEKAAEKTSFPGQFQIELLDALSSITEADIIDRLCLEKVGE